MYGIGSFASQLLVSDSAVCDMTPRHLKTVAVSDEMFFRRAIVVAEYLFVCVAEQMERLYRYVRAFQSALEQAPEILKSVRVDLPIDVFLGMVNRLVNEVLIVKTLIGHERIGIDRALGGDVSANLSLQVMLAPRGDNVRVNLAAALQNADDRGLVLYSAFGNHALAPCRVHESGRAADEGFVYFHFATGAAEFHKVFVVQSKANAVHHEPSRFLGDSESASNFIGTDSVLGIHDEPNGNHPLVHADSGILKDGPDLDSELLLAVLAEPNAPRGNERVLSRIAAWASDFAIWPAQLYRIVERALRVREESDCFLQRLGKLECVCHA